MLVFKYKWLSGLFVIFSLLYGVISLLSEPDKATLDKYHISNGQLHVLQLTIVIPYVAIWFIALVGYLRFKDYTAAIEKSKDGSAFAKISKGILLLTLWLPLSAVLNSMSTNYYRAHPSFTNDLVIFNNYANLLLLLPAFLILNHGGEKLLGLIRKPLYQIPQSIMLLFIAFSALYVLLTLQDPARQAATATVHVSSYYMSDWVIVLTIVIPRLIMWFLGIQAIYYIYLFRQKVKGKLYKDALSRLAQGLAWVVASIIVLRCFQSLSSQLVDLSLGLLLLIVYLLLVLISIGYVLIAKGAKSLKRIEEI